jgi:hypothetical protein
MDGSQELGPARPQSPSEMHSRFSEDSAALMQTIQSHKSCHSRSLPHQLPRKPGSKIHTAHQEHLGYATDSPSFSPTFAASNSSALGVPGGPTMTAGSAALSLAAAAHSFASGSSSSSASFARPAPFPVPVERAAAATETGFQLARRAMKAAVMGDETGVPSSSSGAGLSAGSAVSRNGCTGAAVGGWCGKCVGTTVREGAAAGFDDGEMASGGDTVSSRVVRGAPAVSRGGGAVLDMVGMAGFGEIFRDVRRRSLEVGASG